MGESETIERVGVQGATFVDPNELTSYFTVALTKPMGIAFVENAGDCKGLVVEEVMDTGSAAASEKSIISGDQLVAGDTVKLVFFRGPTNFLYGPTKPDEEWYRSNLL